MPKDSCFFLLVAEFDRLWREMTLGCFWFGGGSEWE